MAPRFKNRIITRIDILSSKVIQQSPNKNMTGEQAYDYAVANVVEDRLLSVLELNGFSKLKSRRKALFIDVWENGTQHDREIIASLDESI